MNWNFKQWHRNRILRRVKLEETLWRSAFRRCRFLRGLTDAETAKLRDWVILFLRDKQIYGAGGLELHDEMRVFIALQACVLILNLDLDYYKGWNEIIVYPAEFIPRHERTDEAGVVHVSDEPLAGESWLHGPVILSWDDVKDSGAEDGTNVVIHEFAHKIDMLNGGANGHPPLHRGMSREAWTTAFSRAYREFCVEVEAGKNTALDPYAAEDPAEFFAVVSEAFFETPDAVLNRFPAVYEQLKQLYSQDPINRFKQKILL